jgi:hypothetical protein
MRRRQMGTYNLLGSESDLSEKPLVSFMELSSPGSRSGRSAGIGLRGSFRDAIDAGLVRPIMGGKARGRREADSCADIAGQGGSR